MAAAVLVQAWRVWPPPCSSSTAAPLSPNTSATCLLPVQVLRQARSHTSPERGGRPPGAKRPVVGWGFLPRTRNFPRLKAGVADLPFQGRYCPSARRCFAQCDQCVEYQAVDLQALVLRALAQAESPLGRNADAIDAALPRRRLDALDELRHLPLECLGRPEQVGPEGNEQVAVVALRINAGAGKQPQRLDHQCK